jgi:hypothetical protein
LNQSWQHVRRRQNSAFQGTSTYCILRARAEGIRPHAEAGLRTLPGRSLDKVVEGRIGLEKEAYGRLARGIRTTKPLLFWLRSVSFVIRAEVADEMGYRVKGRGTSCKSRQ